MNISNDVYFIKGKEKSQEYMQEESWKKNSRCKLTDDSLTTVYLCCISPGLMNKMRRASFPIQPNETLYSTSVSSSLKTLSLEMFCFKGSVRMWKRAAGAIKCGTEVCGMTSYQIYSLSIDIHQYLQNTHTGH